MTGFEYLISLLIPSGIYMRLFRLFLFISFCTLLGMVTPAILAEPDGAGSGVFNSPNLIIGIIPSGSSSPFHQELLASANKSALDRGWRTIILTPDTEENITSQKTGMKTLIKSNASIICLNSLDPAALSTEISAADEAAIPVLLYNTLTPAHGLNISGYIGYNQYYGAAEMGSYAARILAEKKNETRKTVQGRVFILRGLPGFHADQRTAGFIAGLSQSPGIRIGGEEVAGWDREKARQIAGKALIADQGIDIIYGNSDEMAIGAALAAMEQGKEINKDIYILGIDGNTPTLEMIRNGTITATLGVYPDLMGKTVIDQAEKTRTGEQVTRYIETPAIVVDSENIDAYMNRSTWTDPRESDPEMIHSSDQ
jgi:ribose transport system substrate-binding protein